MIQIVPSRAKEVAQVKTRRHLFGIRTFISAKSDFHGYIERRACRCRSQVRFCRSLCQFDRHQNHRLSRNRNGIAVRILHHAIYAIS